MGALTENFLHRRKKLFFQIRKQNGFGLSFRNNQHIYRKTILPFSPVYNFSENSFDIVSLNGPTAFLTDDEAYSEE